MLPAPDKRISRAIEAHGQKIDAEVICGIFEADARQTLTEHELEINAMVISRATVNEMTVAEKMIARAGTSQVAQTIAADRINRLMMADDRTMSRGGF